MQLLRLCSLFSLALFGAAAAARVLAPAAGAQETVAPRPIPHFSAAERGQIVGYWNAPGRYQIGPRDNAATEGPWAVRLTPEASLWHFRYQRLFTTGKILPTQDAAKPPDAERQGWEKWVAEKVEYDRHRAERDAALLNAPFLKTTASAAAPPPFPGPVPLALEAAVGNPPPFAAAVAPREYSVRFHDGYAATYHDNIASRRLRSAYFRFAEGVSHFGVAIRNWPEKEVNELFARAGMTPFEQNVAKAVSRLEGGFESVNTYDTGFVSVGFIQFASLSEGSGSLGGMLRHYKRSEPANFQDDFRRFGIDVTGEGVLVALDPATGGEVRGPAANAKIIADKRLIAVFQRAGKLSDSFRVAQIQNAKTRFYPAEFKIEFSLDGRKFQGKVAEIIHSEAGMATLFDRSVNTGNIRLLNEVLPKLMAEKNLRELSQVAPYEREIIQRMKWRHDFLLDETLSQPR